MITLPITLRVKDPKGGEKVFSSSVNFSETPGETVSVTLGGRVKLSFVTETYERQEPSGTNSNSSENLEGRVFVELSHFEKVKRYSGIVNSILVYNYYNSDGSINQEFSDIAHNSSSLEPTDFQGSKKIGAFVNFSRGVIWLGEEKIERFMDRFDFEMEVELSEWTYRPVRAPIAFNGELFRSPTNNLILRDGD
ncbi:MAG: hypothetical protein IKC27_09005 [Kiritimatiellae bacterium]|nr:hypothetical protein [Kiritimatiellia bacterium]